MYLWQFDHFFLILVSIELAMLKEMGRGLKSTLQTFLPQLAIANTELQKRIQREGNNQTVDIMNISSDVPRYIEMVSLPRRIYPIDRIIP